MKFVHVYSTGCPQMSLKLHRDIWSKYIWGESTAGAQFRRDSPRTRGATGKRGKRAAPVLVDHAGAFGRCSQPPVSEADQPSHVPPL